MARSKLAVTPAKVPGNWPLESKPPLLAGVAGPRPDPKNDRISPGATAPPRKLPALTACGRDRINTPLRVMISVPFL